MAVVMTIILGIFSSSVVPLMQFCHNLDALYFQVKPGFVRHWRDLSTQHCHDLQSIEASHGYYTMELQPRDDPYIVCGRLFLTQPYGFELRMYASYWIRVDPLCERFLLAVFMRTSR
jgi:hypothetical protein